MKPSALWEGGDAEPSAKVLAALSTNVKSFQERVKPTAEGMRKRINTILSRLDPLLEKGRSIMDKVASLDANAAIMGKIDVVSDVVKDQLEELFKIEHIDLSNITDPEHISIALDHVAAAAAAIRECG